MARLNNAALNTAHAHALRHCAGLSLLDLCPHWSLTSLLAVKAGAAAVDVCGVTSGDVLESLAMHVEAMGPPPCCYSTHLRAGGQQLAMEEFTDGFRFPTHSPRWDAVLCEVVTSQGQLTPGLLTDLSFVKQFLLRPPSGPQSQFIPAGFTVVLQALSCDELRRFTRISPPAVFGFAMTPMDEFAVEMFLDLDLRGVPHTPLSEEVPALAVAFDAVCSSPAVLEGITASVSVPITATGSLNAVAFWFRLPFDDVTLSTGPSAGQHYCKQAAVLFPTELSVVAGQAVPLCVCVRNGSVHIAAQAL